MNLTTVDDVVSICSNSVDTNKMCMHRHTSAGCVVSVTAGVASLQMAGATHTLPVVIQYVLYNNGEQQGPSLHWRHNSQTHKKLFKQRHETHTGRHVLFMYSTREGCYVPLNTWSRSSINQQDSCAVNRLPVRQIISLSVSQSYICAVSHTDAGLTVPRGQYRVSHAIRNMFERIITLYCMVAEVLEVIFCFSVSNIKNNKSHDAWKESWEKELR